MSLLAPAARSAPALSARSRGQMRWYPPRSSSPLADPHGIESLAMDPPENPTKPADRLSHGTEHARASAVPLRSAKSIGTPLYSPTHAVLPFPQLAICGASNTYTR